MLLSTNLCNKLILVTQFSYCFDSVTVWIVGLTLLAFIFIALEHETCFSALTTIQTMPLC